MTGSSDSPARRQFLAIAALELRRRFLGRRAILVYLLAAGPALLLAARAVLVALTHSHENPAQDAIAFAVIFRILVLRLTVFFGCVIVFTGLIRGEMLDRSLHYVLLTPMSRRVLALGKFAAGWLATTVLFAASTAASWVLVFSVHGGDYLVRLIGSPEGFGQLASYVLVVTLACGGYGAVFLLCGIAFRTPIAPALVILVWENINALLPAVLQKVSVIHYLESLCPVSLPAEGPIQILSTPSSPWVAVPGLLVVSAVCLFLSIRRLERIEILYGTD